MTNLSYILLSIAIPCAGLCLAAALFLRFAKEIVNRLSLCVAIFVVSWLLIYLAQPILWGGALLFSSDRLYAPLIRGIGGAAYGLEYRHYILSSVVYLIIGITPLTMALLTWKNPIFEDSVRSQGSILLTRLNGIAERLKAGVLFLAFVLCALAFFRDGWDKLWYSPLQRFELLEGQGLVTYLFANKFITLSLTFLGILSCVLLYITPRSWLFLAAAIICCLPFAATLSRAYTVIVVALSAAVLWRTRFYTWIRILLLSVAAIYALLIPLVGRGLDGTGMLVFIRAHKELVQSPEETLSNGLLLGLVQNVSVGQPLLVEAMQIEHEGGHTMSDAPTMFWVLSLSPTMSFIDGYDPKYIDYNPRVNIYTPFNAIAILWMKSSVALFSFVAVIGFASCVLMRALARFGAPGYAAGLLVLVCLLLAIIRSTQYDLRTMMRYCYVGWSIGGISYIVLMFARPQRRLVWRPLRNKRSEQLGR